MIGNEIEIMRDELRTGWQQRIGLDQYLAMAKQTPEELATELREPAARRVKVLLVLSAIAEKEGIDATRRRSRRRSTSSWSATGTTRSSPSTSPRGAVGATCG